MILRCLPSTLLAAAALALPAAPCAAAGELAPAGFSWRATLDTQGHAGLVRVGLPGEALAALQSRTAADLRVFDAQGRPVPFAIISPAAPAQSARQQTAQLTALPLHTAAPGTLAPRGALQVRVEAAGKQSVWVQVDGGKAQQAGAAQAQRLPSALFDTRAWTQPVSGLLVRARLPDNVPVRISASSSSDLAVWTPVAVQGRIYRFDGPGAPANDRLELDTPLKLQDRYLRLDWSGQSGVEVDAVAGLLAGAQPEPAYPAVTLPEAFADGATALEWPLPFATPIRRLELATAQPNTLLPLRVLGRNRASEPWLPLTHTLVYRLGETGQESTNAAVDLQRPSVRWLRVEATHGAHLQGVPLAARVLFDPVEVVFPAGTAGPYLLAGGRADVAATALPVSMLAAATTARLDALPEARITRVQSAPAPAPAWARWLPRGVDTRAAALWLVLLLGVLVLGGVAWGLLRQVNAKD